MNRRELLSGGVASALGFILSPSPRGAEGQSKKRLLFFAKSSGPSFPGCADVKGGFERPPYPATWARMHGKGRVFYTSMGHREDVWTNPIFQNILAGGISWALGETKANVAPNVEKVTPGSAVIPPEK